MFICEQLNHNDEQENGGKIPIEIVENIFMPFFTTKHSGTGIGLSISRQIMRLHEGSLKLTSNNLDRTTFTIKLK